MENKIVLFSNIKGGVGKTTLCALFASYLAENSIPVIAIDADLQASLYRHRQREQDVAVEVQAPWNVDLLDTADSKQLKKVMAQLKKVPGVVLIDCPGNLNDRNLEYIYKNADTAVIPISFDPDTVDATGIFIKALKSVSEAQLVFIPNRINIGKKIRRIEAESSNHRTAWPGGNRHADSKTKCQRETLYNFVPIGKGPTGYR